ncbi:MAG TPA: hypothetical protein VGR66_00940 [Candidatus Eisenbacteria bacterium]|nr:hypothetical protein [Candidatus Eisenbacteria bacterium]
MPKSVQASTILTLFQWLEPDYKKDDFETDQQFRERMAHTPLDPKLRVIALSPAAYAYDAERHVLSIPLHHKQWRSQHWSDVFIYGHADDLGLPIDYGLSVPAESEFGQLLAQGDTSGIKLPANPATADAMHNKRVDCLLLYRLIRGDESSPIWEKRSLHPGWDNGPEMYTWRYLYADVVGLWLFDPSKKRPVIQKFAFAPR